MKRAVSALLIVLLLFLYGCNGQLPGCDKTGLHVDENGNGICDVCYSRVPKKPDCILNGQHTDSNLDYVCDECESPLERPNCNDGVHTDADGNGICDKCEISLENPGCEDGVHTDVDGNGICDKCSEQFKNPNPECTDGEPHADGDDNGICDKCEISVLVYVDFYVINDLHGKLADTDEQIGVDELTTYIKEQTKKDDNTILLSVGDMWQGSSESNLTEGLIITDWMNHLDFAAMTLGNHEFDFGADVIKKNADAAEFPILAINVFERSSGGRAEFCAPSVFIDLGEIQVGIIGAIGDCYSSIATDKSAGYYFKVGSELTALVKAESTKLRDMGADFIVYSIHDGYGSSGSSSLSNSNLSSYYDPSLSGDYVDLVFEAHTHQRYVATDTHGVYHVQSGGDNNYGISHVEIYVNFVTGTTQTTVAEPVTKYTYQNFADDPIVNQLLLKYADVIDIAGTVVGYNPTYMNRDALAELVAQLYRDLGVEVWGDEYDIFLGGGFIQARSPYKLAVGEVTYGDLQTLFCFDNQIVLCKILGSDLKRVFINTDNSSYHMSYTAYGNATMKNIKNNEYYYVVVDSYTSTYSWNNLVEVVRYTDGVYARDLLADYFKNK
ncbi:MAG: bifunctional metallophosphatase/5'-nucleotidase [Clostridia bacterium]|nr:bifunctional metallophosphatase/5'-nucleotidase [Clostridia bacterium]